MTADYRPPCQLGNPDDWFIERDGRQYSDEPVLSADDVQDVMAKNEGKPFGEVEEAIEDATADRLKENLVKRRHAKDACYTDCYFRGPCLEIGLGDDAPTYGIYGGYYPEELRQIRRERDARRRPPVGLD